MTTFIDGPAKGQTLMLRRAPLYLRVVRHSITGEWDALDQIKDRPAVHEEVTVYERREVQGTVHINYGGGKGGWYQRAVYELAPTQPETAIVRENARWQSWCRAQVA